MIRVALGDGTYVNVQTDDPQAAAAAAKKYLASRQPPPKKGFAETVAGTMSGAVDKLKADLADDYKTGIGRVQNVPNILQAPAAAIDSARRGARVAGDVLGVIASPATGVAEAAIVQPYANLMDKVPLTAYTPPSISRNAKLTDPSTWIDPGRPMTPQEKHEAFAKDMRLGLSAVGPGKGAPVAPPAAPAVVPNALRETVAAFDRAGVEPSLAAVQGGAAAKVANVTAENIAGVRPRAQMRRQATQAATKASDIAGGYGEARGRQITGENVQAGVKRFAQDADAPTSFAAKANQVYDKAFAAIPNEIVTPTETAQTLSGILNRVSAPGIAELVKSPQVEKVAQALASDQGKITFSDLRELRTWVRTAKKTPELRQGMSDADLNSLEGALSRDIAANAGRLGGPQAAAQLRRADQFYAAGQTRIKTALTSFDKAGSGEAAYSRILQAAGSTSSADAQKLLSLKRSLAPDEWGDVAANVVNELGKPTSGAAGVTDPGAFSVSTFVTNYAKLSPRGREVLFGSVGGGGSKASSLRAELDNLAKVADKLKAVEKGANASNSGTAVQGAATITGLALPGAWPVTLKIMATMAGAGEAMTNPAFVRWLARTPKVATTGPAWQAHLDRLGQLARANASLAPLYEGLAHSGAGPALAAAEPAPTEQRQ